MSHVDVTSQALSLFTTAYASTTIAAWVVAAPVLAVRVGRLRRAYRLARRRAGRGVYGRSQASLGLLRPWPSRSRSLAVSVSLECSDDDRSNSFALLGGLLLSSPPDVVRHSHRAHRRLGLVWHGRQRRCIDVRHDRLRTSTHDGHEHSGRSPSQPAQPHQPLGSSPNSACGRRCRGRVRISPDPPGERAERRAGVMHGCNQQSVREGNEGAGATLR